MAVVSDGSWGVETPSPCQSGVGGGEACRVVPVTAGGGEVAKARHLLGGEGQSVRCDVLCDPVGTFGARDDDDVIALGQQPGTLPARR